MAATSPVMRGQRMSTESTLAANAPKGLRMDEAPSASASRATMRTISPTKNAAVLTVKGL